MTIEKLNVNIENFYDNGGESPSINKKIINNFTIQEIIKLNLLISFIHYNLSNKYKNIVQNTINDVNFINKIKEFSKDFRDFFKSVGL